MLLAPFLVYVVVFSLVVLLPLSRCQWDSGNLWFEDGISDGGFVIVVSVGGMWEVIYLLPAKCLSPWLSIMSGLSAAQCSDHHR